jgi:folate-binding protein YgfZ
MNRPTVARLPTLGVLRLSGQDTRRFLQGQVSNDLDRLAVDRPLRAGLHTAQGRVIALLQLFAVGTDVLAVLPRELAEPVRHHLARYVLRAKVRIEDVSLQYAVYGVQEGNGRTLRVQPCDAPAPDGEPGEAADWLAADVADGLPQVHAATSERFVAQMLNLDRVEGISFTKGCYTGQEIIARAHYRGRVKRRMQRFITRDPHPLTPGERVQLAGGAAIDIIEVARHADGAQDFLAVAPLPDAGREQAVDDLALPRLAATPAPLPYPLEETYESVAPDSSS